VPRGLKRYQQAGELHFITFSCYRRLALLGSPQARRIFQQTLERVRRWYGLGVFGYVVMPEHVHLLVSEPEHSSLAVAIQMLKQIVAQKLSHSKADHEPTTAYRHSISTPSKFLIC